jgi:VanZ family protein
MTPFGKFNCESDCPPRRIWFFIRVQKTRAFLKFWLPVLIWMTLIFSASADSHSSQHSSRFVEPLLRWLFPQMPQAQIEAIHHIFRKCAHLAEYSILALLLWRAIRKPEKGNPRPWNWTEAGLALSIVFLYAASDELHQVFVPTRTAQVSDVLIDTSGGATALFALWIFGHWRKCRQTPP